MELEHGITNTLIRTINSNQLRNQDNNSNLKDKSPSEDLNSKDISKISDTDNILDLPDKSPIEDLKSK